MERKIAEQVTGFRTIDGAGVSLVRVLGPKTIEAYDPILLFDSFDSTDPEAYIAGFPFHPHRGIETISYVYKGHMTHRDSLGNEDTIGDGEVQWMTAGSGIMHEEKLPASERLLGAQLWLNLPAKDKMVRPDYKSIKADEIEEIMIKDGKLRLLAGQFKDKQGYQSQYLPLDYYDIHLEAEGSIIIETEEANSVMLFTLLGDALIGGKLIKEKTAVKLTTGDTIEISATHEQAQVLFVSTLSLKEPVAWGGPIVMNTKEELDQAFEELSQGTFLKDKISY